MHPIIARNLVVTAVAAVSGIAGFAMFSPGPVKPHRAPAPVAVAPTAFASPAQPDAPIPVQLDYRVVSLSQFDVRLCPISEFNAFRGTIHNGDSTLTVHEIVLRIKTNRWQRDFAVAVKAKPLTTASFFVEVGKNGSTIITQPDGTLSFWLLHVKGTR